MKTKKKFSKLLFITAFSIVLFVNLWGGIDVSNNNNISLSTINAQACEDMEGVWGGGGILLMETCIHSIRQYPNGLVGFYMGCQDAEDTCF